MCLYQCGQSLRLIPRNVPAQLRTQELVTKVGAQRLRIRSGTRQPLSEALICFPLWQSLSRGYCSIVNQSVFRRLYLVAHPDGTTDSRRSNLTSHHLMFPIPDLSRQQPSPTSPCDLFQVSNVL